VRSSFVGNLSVGGFHRQAQPRLKVRPTGRECRECQVDGRTGNHPSLCFRYDRRGGTATKNPTDRYFKTSVYASSPIKGSAKRSCGDPVRDRCDRASPVRLTAVAVRTRPYHVRQVRCIRW
jgi:hypothetical protein